MTQNKSDYQDEKNIIDKSSYVGSLQVKSIALSGLFILALIYTLYFARTILIPIAFAVLLSFLLSPLVDSMKQIRIPRVIGAASILIALVLILVTSIYFFSAPATKWVQRAPNTLSVLDEKFRTVREPIEDITETAKKIEDLTNIDSSKGDKLEIKEPGYANILFYRTWGFVAGISVMFVLLFFMMVSGDRFLVKLVNILPSLKNKKQAVDIIRSIQKEISSYLVTIFSINLILGTIIAGCMYALNMPNPILWGVMACLLNFIPYLGPAVGIIIVGLVAALSFDNTLSIILPPLSFLIATSLEGNFITPMILGNRFTLNPVVILLALLLLGWMWGIPGALIAVPMLMILKIVCDKIESFSVFSQFLSK